MNCSENTTRILRNKRRTNNSLKIVIGNRILLLVIATALLSGGIGAVAGYFVKNNDVDAKPKEVTDTTIIYGQCDGKIFTGEMSREWSVSGKPFVPLDVPLDEDTQEFVYYLAEGYDLDFAFVMAVMQQENDFKADSISSTNDYGLMQINKSNHQYLKDEIGVRNFLDPYDNIRSGMFILRKLFEKYESPEKVLMAYNMGERGAAKLWDKDVFETNYSKSVLMIQQKFNRELERKGVKND